MNPPVLSPKQTCTISITFHPAGEGARLATLYIADDAPGSPQEIQLGGTSVAPLPVATFTPAGKFNLSGTVTQGTVAAPQNLVLSNTGSAPLHVTNIVLGGINVNDFSPGDLLVHWDLDRQRQLFDPHYFRAARRRHPLVHGHGYR